MADLTPLGQIHPVLAASPPAILSSGTVTPHRRSVGEDGGLGGRKEVVARKLGGGLAQHQEDGVERLNTDFTLMDFPKRKH